MGIEYTRLMISPMTNTIIAMKITGTASAVMLMPPPAAAVALTVVVAVGAAVLLLMLVRFFQLEVDSTSDGFS